MRAPLEKSGLLDRGGKPTVRELLSSLVFNPIDGTIRLHGERVVMQRAAVGFELRRDLINLLGTEEARIFLMRLGFASGRADARFVRTNWPNLDVADSFTAGTRLHTFSGVVRVETTYNDFDIRRKRFAAEFIWCDSVEAEEFRRERRNATGPVCWTQLGYASGYASEFFDTLVVYKETQCRAEGHQHCRVVGKIADMWGPGDPDVILFRERIAAALDEPQIESRRIPTPRKAESSLSELDRIVVAPVRQQLDRFATMAMPVLIDGAIGTGRNRAARYLHHIATSSGKILRRVAGGQVDADLLAEIAHAPRGAKRGSSAGAVLIDGLDQLASAMQERLVRAIEDGSLAGGPRVIVLANSDLPSAANVDASLWYAVSALWVHMPSFAERAGDRLAIARALLPFLAARAGQSPPALDQSAARSIEKAGWPGNLPEMRAVLAASLANHPAGGPLTGAEIEAQLARLTRMSDCPADPEDVWLGRWLERALSSGNFSMAALERQIYDAAVARTDGNLSAAARLLDLTRAQLAYRLGTTPLAGANEPRPSQRGYGDALSSR